MIDLIDTMIDKMNKQDNEAIQLLCLIVFVWVAVVMPSIIMTYLIVL